MSKSIATLQTAVVSAISIIVISSLIVTTGVYAQNTTNTTTVQQKVANITNATNPTTITISGLNASIIINAINAKIKSIYDGGNDILLPTSPVITKIGNKNTSP